MILFLLQCCLVFFFAIVLVTILVCLEDVRFGMMAHKELKQFMYQIKEEMSQLRREILEDIQELKNFEEGDEWKNV